MSQCAVLGLAATRVCTLQVSSLPGAGPSMMCNFSKGDDNRDVAVHYKCNPGAPLSEGALQYSGTASYLLTVSGASACGAVYRPPLSWGSVFVILVVVGGTLYVTCGVFVNVRIRERPATVTHAFPHYRYWKQLPSLVTDGCRFSWEEGHKAYYLHRYGSGPPLEQSLQRRLAEDVDDNGALGGPGST